MPSFISWHDLRSICIECGKRADFNIEYKNKREISEGYLPGATISKGYCLEHLPEEMKISRQSMIEAAQKPFGT